MSKLAYNFNEESINALQGKVISDLKDNETINTIKYFKESISDLIRGKQKHKLDKRGYVIVVNGSWGAGKSTATYALINALDDKKNPLIRIDKSMLPFGNIDESITVFLNDFSKKLLEENLIDIHSEIRQFILEVTPQADNLSFSANIGPISMSKPLNIARIKANNDEKIQTKFKSVVNKGKTIVILIDDLDRLRPNEITPILRMVEKLRSLPRVLIIMPIFKDVINKALASDLALDAPSAATFLRKLTDASIFIDNNVTSLKTVFVDELSLLIGNSKYKDSSYGIPIVELCWSMLLHILIIEESISKVESLKVSPESVSLVLSPTNSKYLADIRWTLNNSRIRETNLPFPVYSKQGDQQLFVRIGNANYFSPIAKNEDSNNVIERLRGMIDDISTVANVVTTESTVVEHLKTNNSMTFDEALEKQSSSPIFLEVFKPLIDSIVNEPLLENNYKKRDMNILAHMIDSGLQIRNSAKSDENEIWSIFNVVKGEFRKFRL